jgi:hypothetical protein
LKTLFQENQDMIEKFSDRTARLTLEGRTSVVSDIFETAPNAS